MAFYNCNGISSSGGNGGGISSLGKIEEYGYTLSEAKDVFSFDASGSFVPISINDKYILGYNTSSVGDKYKIVDYKEFSTQPININTSIKYNGEYIGFIYSSPVCFDDNELFLVCKNERRVTICRWNNTELECLSQFTLDKDYYALLKLQNGILYVWDNTSGDRICAYQVSSGNIIASFSLETSNYRNQAVYIPGKNLICYQSKSKKYNLYNINYHRMDMVNTENTANIDGVSFSYVGYIDHYIYRVGDYGIQRININSKKVTLSPAINTKSMRCMWMSGYKIYGYDSNNHIYQFADIVNKLTLYLKEGNEILCDINSLHNITSNLIKSTNGYKCTSTGKCELWFREDPEELTYSII